MELNDLNSYITELLYEAIHIYKTHQSEKIDTEEYYRHIALIADGATQEIALSYSDENERSDQSR